MRLIIAITGGRGFIGRRLAARLTAAGHHVRLLGRQPPTGGSKQGVEWHQANLAGPDARALLRFADGADVLFHCAGEIRDPDRMESTNHIGTERLAEQAAGRVGRWVQLSTIGVYGSPRSGAVDENAPLAPLDAYESSKLRGDEALLSVAARTGMPWTMLRPAIVFGRDMPNDSLRGLIDAIRSGRFFYIGRREAILPYVHVDDVVEALMLLGRQENAIGQTFNLSDDVALERFVAEVCSVSGCRVPTLRLPEVPVRVAAAVLQRIPAFPLTLSRIDALTGTARYPIDKIERLVGYSHVKGWRAGLHEMLKAD